MKYSMKLILAESSKGLVPTLNKMGYMLAEPDEYCLAFINYAAKSQDPVLDIGAAYGVATIPALKKGAIVVANDLDFNHLRLLKEQVPESLRCNLRIKQGRLPEQLNFQKNSFSAILASRIFHYMLPEYWETSINKIFDWLRPGGKLFFTNCTPYMNCTKDFIPIFLKNKKRRIKWPGFIDDVFVYTPSKYKECNSFINLMDLELLIDFFEKTKFTIEKVSYIAAKENFPEDIKLNGKELVGLIAVKPFINKE